MTRLVALIAALGCASALAADINIHVAPNGDDRLQGRVAAFDYVTGDGPVATLERARDLVRAARVAGAGPRANILLRAGTYYLDKTLQLETQDSGTETAPMVISGYRNERPTISGGWPVTGLSKHKAAILSANIDPARFGGRRIQQLFIDGEAQTLARHPNIDRQKPISGGWAYVDGTISSIHTKRANDSKRSLMIKPADLRKWPVTTGAEVSVFPRYNWINDVIPVESIDDAGALKLKWDASYDIRPGDRYFVQNLFEELDSPGEWYFDAEQTQLYVWPRTGLSNKPDVVISNVETLISVASARNVHIRGLNLEVAEGAAIKLVDSVECIVVANAIRNVGVKGRGTYAIAVVGGGNIKVIGNDVSNAGGAGILLSGGVARWLKAAGHVAENNYIHHTGQVYKHGVAIELAGIGSIVRNNLIHDLPRMAILVGGNDHIIEYNRIHHTNLETIDSGAIYTSGRDWLSPRGVVIRYNEILDTIGFGYEFEKRRWTTHHFTFGIYLDDNSSGVDIVGNIIGRASWAGVFVRGGSYNRIINNIIFDSAVNQVFFQGFGDEDPFRTIARKEHKEFSQYSAWRKYRGFADNPPDATKSASQIWFQRNLVVYAGNTTKYAAIQRFDVSSSSVNNNAILSRDAEISIDDGSKPGLNWDAWRKLGLDSDSILADAAAIPSDNDWARFGTLSVALKIGFQAIPFSKIGPYKSEDRASWPIVEAKSIRETLR